MKQRILYIDNLKAFAIFLVVVGHVYFFTWSNHVDILWFKFISTVNMALFFFLSGMFAKDEMDVVNLRKKVVQLLLPTITLGSIYAFLHNGMKEFVFGKSHFGYWFLLALFYTFCLFYVRVIFISALRLKSRISKNVVDICLLIGICGILKVCVKVLPQDVASLFCLEQLANYVPYFWMGFLVRQNRDTLKIYFEKYNEYLYALSVISFAMLFYQLFYSSLKLPGCISKVVSVCGIYILMVSFREWSHSIVDKIQFALSWIGSHTLEIYVLQYFFLPDSYKLSDVGSGGVNSLLFAVLESILCLLLCVATIKLLSINRFLRLIFFGKR